MRDTEIWRNELKAKNAFLDSPCHKMCYMCYSERTLYKYFQYLKALVLAFTTKKQSNSSESAYLYAIY